MDYDLERLSHRRRRQRRRFRERINFDTNFFVEKFRISIEEFEEILELIKPHLEQKTQRNCALSAKEQILIAFRYLATGSLFRVIGDAHGVSPATVSRCVRRVVKAINRLLFHSVVRFPDEMFDIPAKFREVTNSNMPCVVGLVDGTHVKIISPSCNEEQFVNRHDSHSINCMLVCGPNLKIYYCSSRWPGSVHDSRILRMSSLARAFDEHLPFPNAIILGDSGYALSNWLVTPINAPITPAETMFNLHHKRMRRLIECCNGVLKQRFRCLNFMHLEATFAGEVVKACCILHNLLIESRAEIFDVHDIATAEDVIVFAPVDGPTERRIELVHHFDMTL